MIVLYYDRYQLPTDVRVALFDAGHEWVKAVGKRPFLGGEEPSIADLVSACRMIFKT